MSEKHKLLLDTDDMLICLMDLAVLIGDREAMALQQIHYWIGINRKAQKTETHYFQDENGKPHWWVYNTWKKWKDDNFRCWSVSTIRRIFECLEVRGLIITKEHENSKEGKWVTVNYATLDQLMEVNSHPAQIEQGDSHDPAHFEQDPCSDWTGNTQYRDYAETTSEVNTPKISEAEIVGASDDDSDKQHALTAAALKAAEEEAERLRFERMRSKRTAESYTRTATTRHNDRSLSGLTDDSLPSVCKAINGAFVKAGVDMGKVRFTPNQIATLQGRVDTKDGTYHMSPQAMYEYNPKMFSEWLETLPNAIQSKNLRITAGEIVKWVCGYHWNGVGYFAFLSRKGIGRPKPIAGAVVEQVQRERKAEETTADAYLAYKRQQMRGQIKK